MAIRKIFHLADIHIKTLRFHGEYRECFNGLLTQLIELSKGYDRSEIRIVLAGDIFHSKHIISNEQIVLGAWLIKELEKIANVVIISGNHDMLENNLNRMDSISPIIQLLGDTNINYFKESLCYLDKNIVWCVYSIFEGNKRPDIESARLEFGDDKTYIGLFHGPLIGAKTDIGYSIEHGAGLEMFEGLDACMMGDIHLHQVFIHKQIKEIYEDEIEEYKKIGWVLDNC